MFSKPSKYNYIQHLQFISIPRGEVKHINLVFNKKNVMRFNGTIFYVGHFTVILFGLGVSKV